MRKVFNFKGVLKRAHSAQKVEKNLARNIGSSYCGDIIDIDIYCDGDGEFHGTGIWVYFGAETPDLENFVQEIIYENVEWDIVKTVTLGS